jgi:hypothetical protein
MKGILEFNLDDQEDEVAYMRCVKAKDMALVLWDMDQYLRSRTKYAPDSMPSEVHDTLQKTRDILRTLMSNYNIDLNELIK